MGSVEILAELVAIPSVSSMSNISLLDAMAAILEPHGWVTIRQSYTAADGLEKANMLAVPARFRDALPDVELLFVCHTDTVPYSQHWNEATELREQGGLLHGCGSCDVKGAAAGLLAAALAVDVEQLHSSVAFAFTAEEEIGCIGATRLAASGLVRPRRAIVCEPTSLRPGTAGKGYGLAQVKVRGHEAHSAFPAKGVSAIHVAAQMIVRLEREQAGSAAADALFTPPYTTFNVGVVRGGTAKNILAGECEFLVEWRPVPGEDPRSGGELVQRLAGEVAEEYGCVIEAEILRADRGFRNSEDSRLGPLLEEMLGRERTGISFGSEATRFASATTEAVVIGPGDMQTAHSERECVPVSELAEWTAMVEQLLRHGAESLAGAKPAQREKTGAD